jgi:hypothetical protein
MAYDAEFKVEFVPGRYRDVVAREAVLYPVVNFDRRGRHTDARIISATKKLVGMWRARVLELRDHGWITAQGARLPATLESTGGSPVDYMRNCRPNFVSMYPRTRPCKAGHVCPFCWGRMVQGVYDRVDAAFPDTSLVVDDVSSTPGTSTDEDAPSVVLAAGERKRRSIVMNMDDVRVAADGKRRRMSALSSRDFPYHMVTVCIRSAYSARESLPNLVDSFCNSRGRIRAIPFTGALVLTTVEHRTNQWHLSHRYLLMLPPNAEVPLSFSEAPGFRRNEQPTRRSVMEAVARTCKYPRALLVGDPQYYVRILHAINGRRLRALYGCFRNTRQYG